MSRLRRKLRGALAVLLLLTAFPATAQERLLLFQGHRLVEVDTADGAVGTVLRISPDLNGLPVHKLAGGRYLVVERSALFVRQPQTEIGIFDTRTFSFVHVVTVPLLAVEGIESDDYRPRIFYRTVSGELGVIEAPSFTPRVLRFDSDVLGLGGIIEYAEALNAVLAVRPNPGRPDELWVVDAATGAIRRTLTLPGYVHNVIVDNLGRRVYLALNFPFQGTEIHTYDLDSFELLNKTASYELGVYGWSFDQMRRLLYGWRTPNPVILSLDSDLMVRAWKDFSYLSSSLSVSYNNPPWGITVIPSTVRNRAFAVLSEAPYLGTLCPPWCTDGAAFLVALDADTLQPVVSLDLPQLNAIFPKSRIQAFLMAPPPPPRAMTATLSGRRVDLAWRNPGDATHFILEVGTIPGRSNVGMLHVGNTTTWGVDGVPSGTYYVRVRAGNDVGASLPSNEVVVTIP